MGLIRVALAMSVVVAHAGPIFGRGLLGGRTAVECFFVISGFYMSLVLNGKYRDLGKRLWPTFMMSRLTRLFPLYWVVLLLVAAFGVLRWVRGSTPETLVRFAALDPFGLIWACWSNLVLLGQDLLVLTVVRDRAPVLAIDPLADVRRRGAELLLLPQGWSLGIELAFYLIAPMLLKRSVPTLLAIASGSMLVKLGLIGIGLNFDPWTYRFFPSELVYFLLGALAYRVIWPRVADRRRVGAWVAGGILLAALLFPAHAPEVVLVCAPILFAFAVPLLFAWSRRSALDRWIGDLSYPVYLSHNLVADVMRSLAIPVNGLSLIACALVVGAVLLVAVDHPAERRRQRKLQKALSNRAAMKGLALPGF